jgi:hypothetical protein
MFAIWQATPQESSHLVLGLLLLAVPTSASGSFLCPGSRSPAHCDRLSICKGRTRPRRSEDIALPARSACAKADGRTHRRRIMPMVTVGCDCACARPARAAVASVLSRKLQNAPAPLRTPVRSLVPSAGRSACPLADALGYGSASSWPLGGQQAHGNSLTVAVR